MPDLHDILALIGVALLGAGVWWIYPPAALILVGALMIVVGIVGRPGSPADEEVA